MNRQRQSKPNEPTAQSASREEEQQQSQRNQQQQQQQQRERSKNVPDNPSRHSPDELANEQPHYESGSGHHEPHP